MMSLGVERYKVTLVPHNEDWAAQFALTQRELAALWDGNAVEIQHVGSTAIRGIPAKPILDVALSFRCVEALPIAAMEAAGYEYCGDGGIPGRHLFVKRTVDVLSTHHIHAYQEGNMDYRNQILFRDFMNAHPLRAAAYGELKQRLAAQYPEDRIAYTEGKAEFILRTLEMARTK